jgi:hypothetical protein
MTAPDRRVELAREYLRGARQRDINYLPPSRLMSELAETRRQLGAVLAVIAEQPVALGQDQAVTVLSALQDASEAIRERAAHCPTCWSHPADLCDEDADQLSRAEAYDHLAAKLREVMP